MKNRLFIYIPTFNRANLLDLQLTRLSSNFDNLEYDCVHIHVNVNGSFDEEYFNVEKKFSSPIITFRYNTFNIGGNANILLAYTFPSPEDFLWILSDDDLITNGALTKIINLINNGYNVYHFGDYDIEEYATLNINNIFTCTKGAGFGLISTSIFKMSLFKNSIHLGYDFIDSSFPHLAIFIDVLQKKELQFFKIIHKDIFTSEATLTHGTGDYSISISGFGYLSELLPNDNSSKFLLEWLSISNFPLFTNSYRLSKMKGFLIFKYPKVFILYILIRTKRILQKNFFN